MHDEATAMHKHSGTALIVGSADCWERDLAEAQQHRKNATVIAVGNAAALVESEFVVTDHYEDAAKLRELQREFHSDFTVHCTRPKHWIKYTDDVDYFWDWDRSEGTSAYTAVRVAQSVGFDEIILCGCPIDSGDIVPDHQRDKDGCVWPPPRDTRKHGSKDGWNTSHEMLQHMREAFLFQAASMKDVRSMSGYTAQVLGMPKLQKQE